MIQTHKEKIDLKQLLEVCSPHKRPRERRQAQYVPRPRASAKARVRCRQPSSCVAGRRAAPPRATAVVKTKILFIDKSVTYIREPSKILCLSFICCLVCFQGKSLR